MNLSNLLNPSITYLLLQQLQFTIGDVLFVSTRQSVSSVLVILVLAMYRVGQIKRGNSFQ